MRVNAIVLAFFFGCQFATFTKDSWHDERILGAQIVRNLRLGYIEAARGEILV